MGAPATLSEREVAARIEASFARQSFMAALGARLLRVAPGEVEIELPVRRICASSTASSMPAPSPASPIPPPATPR